MGILKRDTAEQPTLPTPEALKQTLVDARQEYDEAIKLADDNFALDKEWVVGVAQSRAQVIGGLIADLQTEQTQLNEVLEEAR